MGKKKAHEIPVSPSSGNVFADLGFAEPEEELTKAQLASHIRQVIKRRRLTQVAAAELMGIDQPRVSALLNSRLSNFSTERLMRLLTSLGQDVELKQGLFVLKDQLSPRPERAVYEIYEDLDLGPGGYAVALSTETRRGVQEAIRRKLKR